MTTFAASIRARAKTNGSLSFDVRWREDGKSKSVSFPDERAATDYARLVRIRGPREAAKALVSDVQIGTPTVDEYAETYIKSKSGVEPKTLEHYRMYMRLSISPAIGAYPISSVTPENIAEWVNGQALDPVNPLSGKTIRNRHGFLSAMFQHAQDKGLIQHNPCRGTRIPETEQDEMVFLTIPEFVHLLEYIPEQHKTLILLLAGTGMRWGEVTALRPGDFDLNEGTVRISRAWKSSKDRGWYIGPPKTKRSRRTLFLPQNLITSLRDVVKPGDDYVFRNRTGGPLRQQNFYEAVWNPARRLANGLPAYDATRKGKNWQGPRTGGVWDVEPSTNPIGKMPRVHDLRHSHASWLIMDGVSIAAIQRELGHESVKTTIDRYGHISPVTMRLAAASMSRALSGVLPEIEV